MNTLSVSTYSVREQLGPVEFTFTDPSGRDVHHSFPFTKELDLSDFPSRARSAFGVDAVGFEDFLGARGGFEDAAEDGFFGAVTDEVGGGLAAEQKRERVNQDAFAGAGFAGQQVEPRAELGDGVVDHGVIFCAQFEEHVGRV